jgi:hypothetical protein
MIVLHANNASQTGGFTVATTQQLSAHRIAAVQPLAILNFEGWT